MCFCLNTLLYVVIYMLCAHTFLSKSLEIDVQRTAVLVHARVILIRVQAIIFCTKFYAIDFVRFLLYVGL